MIIITSIKQPAQGWPMVLHCNVCAKSEIVLNPYGLKPTEGDYFRIEMCDLVHHSVKFPFRQELAS